MRWWAQKYLFSNTWQTISTILAFATAVGAVLGVWDLLAKGIEWSGHHGKAEVAYLWTTFVAIVIGAALYLTLLSTVTRELKQARNDANTAQSETKTERERGDGGQEVLHRTIEQVRRAVLEDTTTFDWHPLLNLMRDYLTNHFDTRSVCVTMKVLQGGKLVTVGRVGDNGKRRTVGESQATSESYVYELFKATTTYKQQVVVQDAWELGVLRESYVGRAIACRFRSIIAFPLRAPSDPNDDPFSTASVLGFLSADSEVPNLFDSWFKQDQKDHDWSKQVLKPARPLDVFYGIADAAATIEKVLAGRRPPASGLTSRLAQPTSNAVRVEEQ